MFSLAWLRVYLFSILLVFATCAHAREDSLFTSSVTYCEPPETLLVQHFEVAFFPGNASVSFNLSAASVQSNVNVTANLFLNVYGMQPLNITLDLCSILDGDLCPLPQYNFTGTDSIVLPPGALSVIEAIPIIAYKIPDLEGFAQLTLTEPSTGIVRACVQATLSNGWTAYQSSVEWGTGGAAIGMLLVSTLLTLFAPDAIAPFRFMELMYLFQTIASSALLSLNYPSIYRAFALNFAWAVGLFPTADSSDIQNAINSLRRRTGGQLADSSSGSVVQFVNRRLSPYNNVPTSSSGGIDSIGSLFRRAADTIDSNGAVATVTTDGDNVLDAGLPIYVNSLNVATANAFMTALFCALMIFAVVLVALGLGYGVHLALGYRDAKRESPNAEYQFDYGSFSRSWILRTALICLSPLLLFIFYQWTLKDSWATALLSVICFITIGGLVGYPIFVVIRHVRQNDRLSLYTPGSTCLAANAPIYAQYRPERFYFFAPILSATVLRAIVIAFAKYSAEAQVGLLIALEAIMVVLLCWQKPSHTRGGDIFSTYLAIVRLVCAGLLVAFLQKLEVKPIPRVVIGVVIGVIFCIAVIVTVFNFILNIGIQRLFSRRTAAITSQPHSESDVGSQGSMMEKGVGAAVVVSRSRPTLAGSERSISAEELHANVRPHNPTPDQSGEIDSSFLTPFPISPTGSTVTSVDVPSLYSSRRSSYTITVGSLLSRQWSISYSQPNSPAGSSAHHGTYHGGGGLGSNRNSLLTASSVGHGRDLTPASLSRPISPSAWRPPSSSGSSAGHVTRQSSAKALEQYLQNHRGIPEHESS